MKPLSFRACVLFCVASVLLTINRSEADSYCPGCTAGIVGAAVGLGVGISLGVYFVHRSHTSLTGCVTETDKGLILTAKDGSNYELLNAPSDVKVHKRLSLRGHKTKTSSGRGFRVDRVSRDYGACNL